ncbi:MAG TPA: LysM peptidoglycan-binding domain-containing protein [Saprospiraceae bacterium]|nr:LysM peptidoglycan-binding domain-containing protein [Saprospiraceae bacterium]
MAAKNKRPDTLSRPILALNREDVGNLDSVLRGYYLSQIQSLEKRKDRKLARRLLQNHLILPKSRQRTSKDVAYIKEILGMENELLEKLEESRLIRRINQSGNNPIYEVSHDTLVEPILAEKRDRMAIAAFLKRIWKYAAVFLLLWFLSGMVFQDAFEVLPDLFRQPHTIDLYFDRQTIGIDDRNRNYDISLPPMTLEEDIKPYDSLRIHIPLSPIDLSRIRNTAPGINNRSSGTGDTIAIFLAEPIVVPMDKNGDPSAYQSFSDMLIPLATYGGSTGDKIYARVSGSLKMTNSTNDRDGLEEYNQPLSFPIQVELGDTLVQAGRSARSVPVSFNLRLTDLFEDEKDKNEIRNLLGDRQVNLNYTVRVGPTPVVPPQVKIEYPAVQGVEVQYADGTRRFISGQDINGDQTLHVVAAGETLFSIAKKYGVVDPSGNTSVQPIKALNNLQGNTLSVGQTLRIPKQ